MMMNLNHEFFSQSLLSVSKKRNNEDPLCYAKSLLIEKLRAKEYPPFFLLLAQDSFPLLFSHLYKLGFGASKAFSQDTLDSFFKKRLLELLLFATEDEVEIEKIKLYYQLRDYLKSEDIQMNLNKLDSFYSFFVQAHPIEKKWAYKQIERIKIICSDWTFYKEYLIEYSSIAVAEARLFQQEKEKKYLKDTSYVNSLLLKYSQTAEINYTATEKKDLLLYDPADFSLILLKKSWRIDWAELVFQNPMDEKTKQAWISFWELVLDLKSVNLTAFSQQMEYFREKQRVKAALLPWKEIEKLCKIWSLKCRDYEAIMRKDQAWLQMKSDLEKSGGLSQISKGLIED
jgi:hypothetical protein